jgi:endogenous inhibitor of DNA gyrase (YacG/DUF329 family)
MVKIVQCPQCSKEVAWQAEEKWRPFCSERCKLIDLGEWASEGHKIAGESLQSNVDIDEYNPSDYH